MPKEEREWGVVLTDTGLNEPEGEIELYVCEESQKQFSDSTGLRGTILTH
jgi:hypothetical protein